jgi:glycosyltransferase involved in cell wall biosynthesis
MLVDGLLASTAAAALVPAARRLSLVVVVHMPLGDGLPGHVVAGASAQERTVLAAAQAVVTTSSWTRERLLDRYALRSDRVHVAEPGADPADIAPGTADGRELLCVAAVTAHKGHDVLLGALTAIIDRPWRCVCVGTLDREPEFVARLRRQAEAAGLDARFCLAGPYSTAQLDRAYAAADVLVLASRGESYGMVVTEALAHGLPVIASAVGGLPEALGHASDGRPPGLLVPPDDPTALASALRDWLSDAGLRQRLRRAAGDRRDTLPGWAAAAARIASVLTAPATA